MAMQLSRDGGHNEIRSNIMTTNSAAGGGMDDDDDLFVEDGWGDDDVDVDLGDDDEGEAVMHQQQQKPPPPMMMMPPSSAAAKAANHNVTDDAAGWDDDDDLDFDDDDNNNEDTQPDGLEQPRRDGATGVASKQQPHQQQQPQQQKLYRTPQEQQLYEDLDAYLQLLPHLQTSVNAIFNAEYNNNASSHQAAIDVLTYYQERPGLLDYTLEKELPRMDYTIILRNSSNNNNNDPDHLPQNKTVLQNKTPETSRAVADCLRRHGMHNNNANATDAAGSSLHHVLPRAANQSLLADLLQVLTGPDRVIRPQYMATAVATSCHFVVDLGASSPRAGQQYDDGHHDDDDDDDDYLHQPPPSVRVTAELSVSLPTSSSNSNNGGRWKVADMTVVAQLILPSNEPPVIDYRLASIRPTINQNHDSMAGHHENLASVVALLMELDMGHNEMMEDNNTDTIHQPSSFNRLHYRDAFLQQSQSFWDNSAAVAVGMKSVLQDIDAVSGLSQKWAALPQLLPSTDLMLEQEAAEAAAAAHWQHQQQQLQLQQQRPPEFHHHQQHHHHPMHHGPPVPPQVQRQQQQQQRPQSILGGMLGKLAKAVALPEEDPDMYRDWQQQRQQQRPGVPPPPPAAAATLSSGPKLYQRERPPPTPQPPRIPPPGAISSSPTPLLDKPVKPPLPVDRKKTPLPAPRTPPRHAAAPAANQPKLSTAPLLGAHPPFRDEDVIDGWDDIDDDALLESENGDEDEDVNVTLSSEVLDPETKRNARPAWPAAPYTKTHGQEDPLIVENNRPSVKDNHATNTSLLRVTAVPPPPPQPAGVHAAPVHDNGGIVVYEGVEQEEEDSDWVYNAEDDCLPTRKRWRNPRPGPRQLASFSSEMILSTRPR
jgi:hypothetical protein